MSEIRKSTQTRRYILADGTIKNYTVHVKYSVKNKNSKHVRIILSDDEITNILKVWDDLTVKNYTEGFNIFKNMYDTKINYNKFRSVVIKHRVNIN